MRYWGTRHRMGSASPSQADAKLLHPQPSSAGAGAVGGRCWSEDPKEDAVLYKHWSIAYQLWGEIRSQRREAGRSSVPPRGIRLPCRGPQPRSEPPPAHAQWILCRPWQRPEGEESWELSSNHHELTTNTSRENCHWDPRSAPWPTSNLPTNLKTRA